MTDLVAAATSGPDNVKRVAVEGMSAAWARDEHFWVHVTHLSELPSHTCLFLFLIASYLPELAQLGKRRTG